MAESAGLVFDATAINQCITNLNSANSKISGAYTSAKDVLESIENNPDMWSGESNYAMQEFMDLCLQYHKYFVDNKAFADKKDSNNPISQAIGALQNAYNSSCSFYDVSTTYIELRDLE